MNASAIHYRQVPALITPFKGLISCFIDKENCNVKVLFFFTDPIFPKGLSLFGPVVQIHVPPVH
jgi:hypothetical protein